MTSTPLLQSPVSGSQCAGAKNFKMPAEAAAPRIAPRVGLAADDAAAAAVSPRMRLTRERVPLAADADSDFLRNSDAGSQQLQLLLHHSLLQLRHSLLYARLERMLNDSLRTSSHWRLQWQHISLEQEFSSNLGGR